MEFFVQSENKNGQETLIVDPTMLPDIYAAHLVQDLLFIGKVVRFLSEFKESEGTN